MSESTHDKIIATLRSKSCLKQDVYALTKDVFAQFKARLEMYSEALDQNLCAVDNRVRIRYEERGDYVCQTTIAGDLLVFVMHTNVSQFEGDHSAWNTSYLRENENRGYCGSIYIYNFLADSFRHNRTNDVGYLIGRLFVNRERHFFVQGKRPMSLQFNDFINDVLTVERIQDVIEAAILYTLEFDLYSPPYHEVQQVTVSEMKVINQSTFFKTGKRVGYKFQADIDDFDE